MSSTAGGGSTQTTDPPHRLGFKPGMVIQELGWDNDTDDELRVAIEDTIDADMVDGDYGNVVDAVVLWWRDDDGDLVDGLVDALTDLVGGGAIWLLTPKVGRPNAVERRRHRRGRADRRPRPDDHRRGQQGLVGHPAGRAQDTGLSRPGHPTLAEVRRPLYPEDSPARAPPARGAKVLDRRPGVIRPYSPVTLAKVARDRARKWGTGPAGGFAALAVRAPTGSGSSTSSAS